jgi:low affinity Fe/Cu permease
MLILCVLLALAGIVAFISGQQLFIAGTSMAISGVTLLLLPVLQASQNRDDAALHAKLDELIKSHADARNRFIGLENRSESEIELVKAEDKPSAG